MKTTTRTTIRKMGPKVFTFSISSLGFRTIAIVCFIDSSWFVFGTAACLWIRICFSLFLLFFIKMNPWDGSQFSVLH